MLLKLIGIHELHQFTQNDKCGKAGFLSLKDYHFCMMQSRRMTLKLKKDPD
ncbi:hypothetical protein ABIE50_001685 [Chitinophaga sp. OAE865]